MGGRLVTSIDMVPTVNADRIRDLGSFHPFDVTLR